MELYTAGTSGQACSGGYHLGNTLHPLELRCHSPRGELKSSDMQDPRQHSYECMHAPPCYIPYQSPSAQDAMGARWEVMGSHMLPQHPTASRCAPSSSHVCRSHGLWADMGWHGRCTGEYGSPWASMGPHGSSHGNSAFSECTYVLKALPRVDQQSAHEYRVQAQGAIPFTCTTCPGNWNMSRLGPRHLIDWGG